MMVILITVISYSQKDSTNVEKYPPAEKEQIINALETLDNYPVLLKKFNDGPGRDFQSADSLLRSKYVAQVDSVIITIKLEPKKPIITTELENGIKVTYIEERVRSITSSRQLPANWRKDYEVFKIELKTLFKIE